MSRMEPGVAQGFPALSEVEGSPADSGQAFWPAPIDIRPQCLPSDGPDVSDSARLKRGQLKP
jgi:hypothetical protein